MRANSLVAIMRENGHKVENMRLRRFGHCIREHRQICHEYQLFLFDRRLALCRSICLRFGERKIGHLDVRRAGASAAAETFARVRKHLWYLRLDELPRSA